MTNTERLAFTTWHASLQRVIELHPRCVGTGGPLIDAALPFRLGWSPERAARALLNIDGGDHQTLVEMVRDRGMTERGKLVVTNTQNQTATVKEFTNAADRDL